MNTINYFKLSGAFAAGCFTAWALFAPVAEEEHDHHDHDHEHEHEVAINDSQLSEHQIAVAPVDRGPIFSSLELRGKAQFHPDLVVHVLPKMAGVVVEAKKSAGDKVQKGEVLAWMESEQMAQAKADYLRAFQSEVLEKARFDRSLQLSEKRLVSEAELQSARADYERAKIDSVLARERLLAYGLSQDDLYRLDLEEERDLRLYALRSPLEGVIINSHLSPGEFVEGIQEAFEIVNPSLIRIELALPMEEQARIRPGDEIVVRSPCTGKNYSAKISYVAPHLKPDTLSGSAHAEMDNPELEICPGMYLSVSALKTLKSNVLRVPNTAIQEFEGKNVVFVYHGDHFHPREVQLGAKDGTNTEIVAGLRALEKVATEGSFLIKADLGKHNLEHQD